MSNDNLSILLMVIAVVTCVLGVGVVAMYGLDRAVDPGNRKP
jgi:hypothetical protein